MVAIPADVEYFPALIGLTISDGPRDSYGRRSWIIGATAGDDARRLEGFFARCGRHKGFMFHPPGMRSAVVARFDVDHLPVIGDRSSKRTEPVPVREMFAG